MKTDRSAKIYFVNESVYPIHWGLCAVPSNRAEVLNSSYLPESAAS